MARGDWPTEIRGNMFTLAKLDPSVQPDEFKVTTWSNLFGSGGSVSIDARIDGRRIDLATIHLKTNGSVVRQRAHLQGLLDDWLATPDAWTDLVKRAKSDVRDYYRKQIDEAGISLAELEEPTS